MTTRISLLASGLLATILLSIASIAAQAPDRSAPPALGPTPTLRLPPTVKRTLSNGLPVWIVESHEVPIVSVSLVVRSGSAADPAGQFGVASVVSAMLDEGTASRTALEIADDVEFLGASLGTSSSFDASAVRLDVPTARLREGLAIMADVARQPAFPQEELDRIRQERLTALLQARDDPASIVATAFPRLVYGPTHRYGTANGGTPETIKAFTAGDLQRFYDTHYRPDRAVVIAVGDVTADEVTPLVENAFGGWQVPTDRAAAPAIAPAPQLAARQVFLIDKPGAAQSQIRIGWIGVPRSTPDYFVLEVLNTILGGAFTSRLNQNLREEHGYSYGAGSTFDMRRGAGPFFAAAGVQTDKTAESITEFFAELTGMHEPIPSGELSKAKNYVALGFPGEFETAASVSRRLEELVAYDLPEDTFSTYIPRIQEVTAAAVARAARQYIQPDKMAVVVVGDAKLVEAPIRALKLGPFRLVPIDEVMGPP